MFTPGPHPHPLLPSLPPSLPSSLSITGGPHNSSHMPSRRGARNVLEDLLGLALVILSL